MIVCRCNEVSLNEIKAFINKHPQSSLNNLIEHTGASTNCGRCSTLLSKTFDKLKKDLPDNKQLRISF